jgi:hypothetical protein
MEEPAMKRLPRSARRRDIMDGEPKTADRSVAIDLTLVTFDWLFDDQPSEDTWSFKGIADAEDEKRKPLI